MSLKPDELADAMLTALPQAWKEVKGTDFPDSDKEDQRVLFIAIARGLLTYLKDNPNDTMKTISLGTDSDSSNDTTYNVSSVVWDITTL